ncbi:hypothetical protein Tco_0940027 [Tanacetum coccineum]|uniref:Uncharacterized protein n=1 Tax=Tanacetum coccineum TaxID=301880 RepID=A0ABQ5DML4_9ASTR
MLAPKGSTFNGRPTFTNPIYLKKAQSEKPCLYEILYDTSDLANIFTPNREETLTLEKEGKSKLKYNLVDTLMISQSKSLLKFFNQASKGFHDQLAHANEISLHVNVGCDNLRKGFNLSSVPLSFNSLTDCSTLLLHCLYLESQSNDGKSKLVVPNFIENILGTCKCQNKSSSPTDNSKQQDTPPTMNIHSSSEPTTLATNVNAAENNDNQATYTQFINAKPDGFVVPNLIEKCLPSKECPIWIEACSKSWSFRSIQIPRVNVKEAELHGYVHSAEAEYMALSARYTGFVFVKLSQPYQSLATRVHFQYQHIPYSNFTFIKGTG